MVLLNKILKVSLFTSLQGLFTWLLTDPGWDLVSLVYVPRTTPYSWGFICNEFIFHTIIVVLVLNVMMEVEPFQQLLPKILISVVGVLLIGFIFRADLVERSHRMIFLLGNASLIFAIRFYPLEYYWVKIKMRYYRRKRARMD